MQIGKQKDTLQPVLNSNELSEKQLQKQYRKEVKQNRRSKKQYNFDGDILFENVSYTYSKRTPFEFRALDNTSFSIPANKITCVIGNTGSGKSTLIQLTNGLLISETGRMVVGDFPLPASIKKIKEVKQIRKEIGLVFQFPEYQLFQDTIAKDIAFGPINMGANKKESLAKVPELLELVDLPVSFKERSPFQLSGGQKRRVAIAGIIAMDGGTLVLDEPTGGLDPHGENSFIDLFQRLNIENNKRIIIVTHNMDQVLKIADNVIVMDEGKMIAMGSPFEIFSREELLTEMSIEPPKIYKLIYKLHEHGLNLLKQEIRTVEDLAIAIKEAKIETKGGK